MKIIEAHNIDGGEVPQLTRQQIIDFLGNDSFQILEEPLPTGDVVQCNFETGKLLLSPVIPQSRLMDYNQVIHELAHYVMLFDKDPNSMEALHTENWGLTNPYIFWSGLDIDDVHPGGGPTKLEAKVWAWQHIIGTMAGLHDANTFIEHTEIKYIRGENLNMPRDEALEKSQALLMHYLQDIYARHPDPTIVVRNAINSIDRLIQHEAQFQRTGTPYESLSEIELPMGAIVEHITEKEWHHILFHSPDKEITQAVVSTRKIERALKLMEVCINANCIDLEEEHNAEHDAPMEKSPQDIKDEFTARFGTDEALGVSFIDDYGNNYTLEEGDALAEQENAPSLQAVFENGDSAITCTNYATLIYRSLPGRVKIFGFANTDNPTSRVAMEEIHPGGHDFAVVDDRYLVDPWIKLVASDGEQICFDLEDPIDAAKVLKDYGPRTCWSHMKECEEYAEKEMEANRIMEEKKKDKALSPSPM